MAYEPIRTSFRRMAKVAEWPMYKDDTTNEWMRWQHRILFRREQAGGMLDVQHVIALVSSTSRQSLGEWSDPVFLYKLHFTPVQFYRMIEALDYDDIYLKARQMAAKYPRRVVQRGKELPGEDIAKWLMSEGDASDEHMSWQYRPVQFLGRHGGVDLRYVVALVSSTRTKEYGAWTEPVHTPKFRFSPPQFLRMLMALDHDEVFEYAYALAQKYPEGYATMLRDDFIQKPGDVEITLVPTDGAHRRIQ